MGNTIWLEVRDRPGAETHHDLSILHGLTVELDALAKRLGVTPPSDFYDYSPVEAPRIEMTASPAAGAADPVTGSSCS
jgi:hypothetical protein